MLVTLRHLLQMILLWALSLFPHHAATQQSQKINAPVIPPAIIAPAYRAAHSTTHRTVMKDVFDTAKAGCSATAIGPHALLTATHCDTGNLKIYIDGDEGGDLILKEMRDGNDHTIFILATRTFDHYAELETEPLELGAQVFIFGNPVGLKDLFRQGQYAGIDDRDESHKDLMLFDLNGFYGDSGSAIFDGNSKIVAVTSLLVGSPAFKTMGALPLKFIPEQIQAAKAGKPTL